MPLGGRARVYNWSLVAGLYAEQRGKLRLLACRFVAYFWSAQVPPELCRKLYSSPLGRSLRHPPLERHEQSNTTLYGRARVCLVDAAFLRNGCQPGRAEVMAGRGVGTRAVSDADGESARDGAESRWEPGEPAGGPSSPPGAFASRYGPLRGAGGVLGPVRAAVGSGCGLLGGSARPTPRRSPPATARSARTGQRDVPRSASATRATQLQRPGQPVAALDRPVPSPR